ncbi:hypothetical protein DEG02_001675 [Xanthomonas vasicola]|nr:hypothetical protein KWO_018830 [Xanthomonas vasicola pv. musacearum NCPPB 4379]RJL87020.1 hypothetical protein DEG03_002095 [Xanthomonas vasicola]RRJ44151.1 hypothetical protein EIM46_02480 [Xanthomonas vasicola pv. musacearum]RJL89657.1 hypothetical protein DEF98_003165 [Xanthomonas vasicola]RJL92255.1 hypothetical protein DEF95_002150 [Xanthomonas vasicola]
MTQAAVLPVVFDQASPALPTALAASRVVSNARGTRSARRANDIAMAIHSHGPSQPSARYGTAPTCCPSTSAACFCMTNSYPPPRPNELSPCPLSA